MHIFMEKSKEEIKLLVIIAYDTQMAAITFKVF